MLKRLCLFRADFSFSWCSDAYILDEWNHIHFLNNKYTAFDSHLNLSSMLIIKLKINETSSRMTYNFFYRITLALSVAVAFFTSFGNAGKLELELQTLQKRKRALHFSLFHSHSMLFPYLLSKIAEKVAVQFQKYSVISIAFLFMNSFIICWIMMADLLRSNYT